MKRKWKKSEESYFGIGVFRPKTEENVGSLWRTAFVLGAQFIFVIDSKYRKKSSDVLKVWSRIPLFQFQTIEAFLETVPYSCKVIGVEMDEKAIPIQNFVHPERAVYLLGSEDHGLTKELKNKCHEMVQLPGESSLNVAAAGSIVIFDRINKLTKS